jgi:hypothetical protein
LHLLCSVDASVPVRLRGNSGRLRQVLLNLGGNAVKFTAHGAVIIRAGLDREDENSAMVRFSVRDTGIGIPAGRQADIFSPFTQGDSSTTRKYGGTGLGLSISKQLVELMGGQIGVESQPGKGSKFWFTALFEKRPVELPGVQELSAAMMEKNEASRLESASGRSSRRILVAEDDATNQKVALAILEKLELPEGRGR